MVFRVLRKVLPQNMSAIAATLCRIPNARISIPAAIGVSPRTVENWLSGATQPTATNLVALMREFDHVTDDVLRMAGKRTMTDAQIEAAKKALRLLEG